MKRIYELSRLERPREKLRHRGAPGLSDLELLAILLGSGTKDAPVMSLAGRLLAVLDRQGSASAADLQRLAGIGPAKAALVIAALEFARRRIRPEGTRITFPRDVLPLIRHYADRKQEYFLCLSLNGANEVMAVRVVSVGLVNQTQVHPREVFADAITDRASSIIVAHNHPSGQLFPSQADLEVTRQLVAAGNLLGILLLDHLIFTAKGYYSFLEKGQL